MSLQALAQAATIGCQNKTTKHEQIHLLYINLPPPAFQSTYSLSSASMPVPSDDSSASPVSICPSAVPSDGSCCTYLNADTEIDTLHSFSGFVYSTAVAAKGMVSAGNSSSAAGEPSVG